MNCEYCDSAECLAYASVERGGIAFPALANDDRVLAETKCRDATRNRALRAEAAIADAMVVAERLASMGWRDAPLGSAAYANGANAAGEAMLSALGGEQ